MVYGKRLGNREIRLITLEPGGEGDQIRFSLNTASLDECPQFEALSYVWGPQIPAYDVLCSSTTFSVGRNLLDALSYLRRGSSTRRVWIDRISINQNDLEERGRQVNLMPDIYSSASMAVVFLGQADPATKAAFDFIKEYAAVFSDHFGTFKDTDLEYGVLRETTPQRSYPQSDDIQWAALNSLLRRPWFTRVWTFQEIVLAKRVQVICGPYELPLNQLNVWFIGFEMYARTTYKNGTPMAFEGERLLRTIFKARDLHRDPLKYTAEEKRLWCGLMSLLHDLRDHKATDPRDKIFAFLGVAVDTKDNATRTLTADYHQTPAEVYTMTARWLLRVHKSLAFLALVEKKDKPDLVSWVPDFRYRDPLNFLYQPDSPDRGEESEYKVYLASGHSKAPTYEEDEGSMRLTVCGIFIGTVIERSEPPGNFLDKNGDALGDRVLDGGEWQAFAHRCASVDGLYTHTREDIDNAYQRLRTGDIVPPQLSSRRQRSPDSMSHNLLPVGASNRKVQSSVGQDYAYLGPSDGIISRILKATTRRRMYRTDTRYLGLGHRSLEVGDQVYILMGADMPYILRPVGGNFFSFGGESYLHGAMDGEILGKARAAKEGNVFDNGEDLSWVEGLTDEASWPFDTEKLILV